MKKSYLTPSILVVEYNQVDIVTASITEYDYTKADRWIKLDWLDLGK